MRGRAGAPGGGGVLGPISGGCGASPATRRQALDLCAARDAGVQVKVGDVLHLLLENFPELDRLVVRGHQEPGAVRALVAPPQRVDLLLNLERLEVVKLGLVGLKLGEVAVLHGGRLEDRPWRASHPAIPG